MAYTYAEQPQNSTHKVELQPIRVIDSNTHKEYLRIEIAIDGVSSGVIECHILTLEKDLQQLREYGTGYLRPDIQKIKRALEEHYWDIKTETVTNSNPVDDNFQQIVDMYSEYITNLGDDENFEFANKAKDMYLYNMPVTDFTDYFTSSDYSSCDIKYFRQKLKREKYIECNTGRTDRNVRLLPDEKKNKIVKCISFYVDKNGKAQDGKAPIIINIIPSK